MRPENAFGFQFLRAALFLVFSILLELPGVAKASFDLAFIRDASGNYTSFNVPGAVSTHAEDINSSGMIVGEYTDTSGLEHGFVRNAAGNFSTFNLAGVSGFTIYSYTDTGKILGDLTLSGQTTLQAFLGDTSGNYSLLSLPGVGSVSFRGTNNSGQIVGFNYGNYSFLENSAGGSFTTFNYPGAVRTFAESITAEGLIVGYYEDNSGAYHGFTRDVAGNYTTFTIPGGISTTAYDINSSGQIEGYYLDSSGIQHFYLRNPAGNFTNISYPGAISTTAYDVGDSGVVVGFITVVPEPSSIVLFGISSFVAGVVLFRRRVNAPTGTQKGDGDAKRGRR